MPTLAVDDGAVLHYEVVGDGPAVLLVQGVGVAGSGWRPQMDGLADRYRLLAWDHRGLGRSTMGRDPLTIERMGKDALALMDAAGFERAHVVGHSMGGVIAPQIALDAPRRVRSLALLCTFDLGKHAVALSPAMLWIGTRTRIGTRRMRRNAFLELVMTPAELAGADRDAIAVELAPLFGRDLGDSPPIVMAQLRCLAAHDIRARLAELAPIPTLVLSAQYDLIARPEFGRSLAAAIPGATYLEAPDAAHGITLRNPAWVNARLAEHFAAADAG